MRPQRACALIIIYATTRACAKEIVHAVLLSNSDAGEIHPETIVKLAVTNSNNKKHIKNKQKTTTNN